MPPGSEAGEHTSDAHAGASADGTAVSECWTLPLRTRQAVDDALPFEEFLFRLLADEVDRRDAKQLEARLRRAQFESSKSFAPTSFIVLCVHSSQAGKS